MLAIVVLLRSALPLTMVIACVIVLILFILRIAHSRIPLPRYHKLSYHPGYWLLHEMNGSQTKYEQVFIGFEGGLFILLTLTGINPRKKLVIFHDQMSVAQYRVLKLTAKES